MVECNNMVKLLEVKSKCEQKLIENEWKNIYNIRITIDNVELDFDTDLKHGIRKEIEQIFSPKEYDYSKFETLYGRVTKEQRNLYGVV